MVRNFFFSFVELLRLNSVTRMFICIRSALGSRVDPGEVGILISALVVLVIVTRGI